MILIERVEAIRFNKVMTSGRTSPLLLTCERADSATIDAVVKFAGGPECSQSSLCAELIAAQLASDLGLPTPTPLIVTWEPAFTDSVQEPQARRIVAASVPPAFGSTQIVGGFATWPTDRKLVGAAVRQMALAVFFFDAMIGNSDRGGMKPNILARGDEFRLIDHEMAFRDYMLFTQPAPPWSLGGLNGLTTPGAHIFTTQLSEDAIDGGFDRIRAAWAALSDQQIEAYGASLPVEWNEGRDLVVFALARIKDCRDRIDNCVAECRRALYD